MPQKPIPGPDKPVDMAFPVRGIDLSSAYDLQRPGTTPLAQNVRGYEPGTDRLRGGSRAGLVKHVPATVTGAYVVQDLNMIVGTSFASPFSAPASGNGFILVQGPTTGKVKLVDSAGAIIVTSGTLGTAAPAVAFDSDGMAYAASGTNASPSALNVVKFSTGGTTVWSASIPTANGQTTALAMVATPATTYVLYTDSTGIAKMAAIDSQSSSIRSTDAFHISDLDLTPSANHTPTMTQNAAGQITLAPAGSGPADTPTLIQLGPGYGARRDVDVPGVSGAAISGYRVAAGRNGDVYASVIDTTNSGSSHPSGVVKIDANGLVEWTNGFLYDGSNALNWYNASGGVDYPLELAFNDDGDALYAAGRYQAGPSNSYNLIAIGVDDGSIALHVSASPTADVSLQPDPDGDGVWLAFSTTVEVFDALLGLSSSFATTSTATPIAVAPQ